MDALLLHAPRRHAPAAYGVTAASCLKGALAEVGWTNTTADRQTPRDWCRIRRWPRTHCLPLPAFGRGVGWNQRDASRRCRALALVSAGSSMGGFARSMSVGRKEKTPGAQVHDHRVRHVQAVRPKNTQ